MLSSDEPVESAALAKPHARANKRKLNEQKLLECLVIFVREQVALLQSFCAK